VVLGVGHVCAKPITEAQIVINDVRSLFIL